MTEISDCSALIPKKWTISRMENFFDDLFMVISIGRRAFVAWFEWKCIDSTFHGINGRRRGFIARPYNRMPLIPDTVDTHRVNEAALLRKFVQSALPKYVRMKRKYMMHDSIFIFLEAESIPNLFVKYVLAWIALESFVKAFASAEHIRIRTPNGRYRPIAHVTNDVLHRLGLRSLPNPLKRLRDRVFHTAKYPSVNRLRSSWIKLNGVVVRVFLAAMQYRSWYVNSDTKWRPKRLP